MIKRIKQTLSILLFISYVSNSSSQEKTDGKNQYKELGKVSWYRDYNDAVALSLEQDKPILILFQEVPGCSTCRNYGKNVLSHPLMTEAIEDLFIPLAIFNNKEGKDKETLKKFNEPSWNNPVVRIIDPLGNDIVKRVGNDYTALGLYSAMTYALTSKQKIIPEYLSLLGEELIAINNNSIKEKYVKLYCFWSGEKQLGSINGVLNTEAGFMNGHEIVKVKYDENKISKAQFSKYASTFSFSPITKDHSYRPATNDEDYYLRHTKYKYLPLTLLQRTRINSELGNNRSGKNYLSPRQVLWYNTITNNSKTLFNINFEKAWIIKSEEQE